MSEAIYPKGVMAFSPHAKAPDFVRATIVITPNQLIAWLKENPSYLSDYKGEKQIKLQLKSGNKGLYLSVDTYEGGEKKVTETKDDLPF